MNMRDTAATRKNTGKPWKNHRPGVSLSTHASVLSVTSGTSPPATVAARSDAVASAISTLVAMWPRNSMRLA